MLPLWQEGLYIEGMVQELSGCEEQCPEEAESANYVKTKEVEFFIMVEESLNMATHDDVWIIDTGVSQHMTSHNDWYTSLRPTRDELKVLVGNGVMFPVKGVGTISFKTKKGSTSKLTYVLWVPDVTITFYL